MCLYDVDERLLLRRFQVTHNRSLDGVLDSLDSRQVTDAGPLGMIDDSDSEDDALRPSVAAGEAPLQPLFALTVRVAAQPAAAAAASRARSSLAGKPTAPTDNDFRSHSVRGCACACRWRSRVQGLARHRRCGQAPARNQVSCSRPLAIRYDGLCAAGRASQVCLTPERSARALYSRRTATT